MYVAIENENYIRALGEKWFGIAKNIRSFVTVQITNDGIGCGVIKNNEILRSKNSLLGEIGHIKTLIGDKDFKDLMDFEYYLGAKYLNNIIKQDEDTKLFLESPLKKLFYKNEKIKIEDLFNCYNDGDVYSRTIMNKLSNYLISLLNIIVCTYDPDLIIIHGKYAILNNDYYKLISKSLEKYVFPSLKKKIVIKKSFQTREMAFLGAASMVFEQVNI